MPEPDREVGGAYIGDLLSWVMGRADADCVWITIMSNLNIVAVATLSEVSCILLAEGVSLDSEVRRTAEEKGVNVLKTDLPAYEAAVKISKVLC
jgi:predicted transcriptional regulator